MHPTSTLIGLIALASDSQALVVPRIDPYVGDLRTFGQPGCSADNQGVGTFTQSMTGVCNVWPELFSSLYVHITDGWVFRAHDETNCQDNGTVIQGSIIQDNSPIVCSSYATGWIAYRVDRVEPPGPPEPSSSPAPSEPLPSAPPRGPPYGGPPFGGPPFEGPP
ncbi:hypothetical protein F4804DRAFT_94075 [Jackrogersella minutella]|nr:hypothetical protein F4804DRAFT_94075 [Jackrogersella minutella]